MNIGARYFSGFAIAGGAATFLVLAAAQAQAPLPKVSPNVIEQLDQARAIQGSPLAGTSFADSGHEFADSVREVAGQRFGEAGGMPLATVRNAAPRELFVTALREAARVLEEAAADLEDSEAYQEADALRDRAKSLRLGAREAANSPTGKPSK
jgi:hypothetical protein